MPWVSKTNQFYNHEIRAMEAMPSEQLVMSIIDLPPLTALRAVAEVMLNGDNEKLHRLLISSDATERWQQYERGWDVVPQDHQYARTLRDRLEEMRGQAQS